jgi:Tfp pilus assembly protein PilN
MLVAGAVVLAAAWSYRAFDHTAARRNLEMLADAHEGAIRTQRAWEDAQQKLQRANDMAALITYLKHPFTTSQTLSAVISPMSDALRLTEIKIVRETRPSQDGQASPQRNLGSAPDAAQLRMPPAQRDLTRLRDQYDNQQVVVLISGDAQDGEALHQYIRRLSSSDVFSSAELTSLQRDASTPHGAEPQSHFQARGVMRPCIGQPGGQDVAAGEPKLALVPLDRRSMLGAVVAEREASKR